MFSLQCSGSKRAIQKSHKIRAVMGLSIALESGGLDPALSVVLLAIGRNGDLDHVAERPNGCNVSDQRKTIKRAHRTIPQKSASNLTI
jgi:hypothetical protein